MSNLAPWPQEAAGEPAFGAGVDLAPVREVLIGRDVVLGGIRAMAVTRTLPHRDRRMVGAWCFLDHFGEAEQSYSGEAERGHSGEAEQSGSGEAEQSGSGEAAQRSNSGMLVPPHPHTGLQTVTWLVDGEVHHRDSLGTSQLIRPSQLNLMTAGRGIAHSEQSPPGHSSSLHGVQLWVALPDAARAVAPAFEHHEDLPVLREPGASITVLMGTLGPVTSPASTYSPLVGAEVRLDGTATARLPLDATFEHAVLAVSGAVTVDGMAVERGSLIYLGADRTEVEIVSDGRGRVLLIGGEPFAEQIVMWWNFVAHSHDEIVRFRQDWMGGLAAAEPGPVFGRVLGFDGDPLPAPTLPATRLKPRGRVR